MENSYIWKSMGLLDGIDNDTDKKNLTQMFDKLCEDIENDIVEPTFYQSWLEEWWNSYLPRTDEEWAKYADTEDDEIIDEVKKICQFDDVVLTSLVFTVLTEMFKENNNINYDLFLISLSMVNMKPLTNKKFSDYKYSYGDLYEAASEIIKKQCLAFYKIISFLKDWD